MIETIIAVGSVIKTGLDLYGNWKTAQHLVTGDPMQKCVDQLLAAQQAQQAEIQKISERLFYAANRDGMTIDKTPTNMPVVEPTPEVLTELATPIQGALRALNKGDDRLLGSALIALPPQFISVSRVFGVNYLEYFIKMDPLLPPDAERVAVVFNNAYGKLCIGFTKRDCLAQAGFRLHHQWQPNRRVLPPTLKCKEDEVRRILRPRPPQPPPNLKSSSTVATIPLEERELHFPPDRVGLTDASVLPNKVFRDRLTNGGEGPEMVLLEPGAFQMGGNKHDDEKPIHAVTIAYAFAMGKHQVTFDEYDAFCDAEKRSKPKDAGWGRGRRPVINVSWDDASAYCRWLSKQTGKTYRLPSEAEWEYACRAGTTTEYYFGDDATQLGQYAWFNGNSEKKTHPVGERLPNPWSLYDMHGNVWEWCQDCWHSDYKGAPIDGSAWDDGASASRLLRGCAWYDDPDDCRAANRYYNPYSVNHYLGFRVVLGVAARAL